jgi:predicted transcriptional regulator
MELKTARLTILIESSKKQALEQLCRRQDTTPSQVVRRLIRDYMESLRAEAAVRKPVAARSRAR